MSSINMMANVLEVDILSELLFLGVKQPKFLPSHKFCWNFGLNFLDSLFKTVEMSWKWLKFLPILGMILSQLPD